ncbi:hypothetical protein K501DRAFT_280217 [Backusella circina FSU 941]|nr:hypothetical protein K501DRAFT_280217 [Backusella circina FSU 941]
MAMRNDEPISDYTTRFQKAVHDVHLSSQNDRLAERFLVSLMEPKQLCAKIVFQANSIEGKTWSIQEIPDIARKVMGDNYKAYKSSASIIDSKMRRTGRRDIEYGISRDPRIKGKLFNKNRGFTVSYNGNNFGLSLQINERVITVVLVANSLQEAIISVQPQMTANTMASLGHLDIAVQSIKKEKALMCKKKKNNGKNDGSTNNSNHESSVVKPTDPVIDLEMQDVYQKIFDYNKFPRIGTTPLLKVNYANDISCQHELFEFEDKTYAISLSVDISPNLTVVYVNFY